MKWNGQRERERERRVSGRNRKAIFSVGNLRPKRGKLRARRAGGRGRRSTGERTKEWEKNRTAATTSATVRRRQRRQRRRQGGRRSLGAARRREGPSLPPSPLCNELASSAPISFNSGKKETSACQLTLTEYIPQSLVPRSCENSRLKCSVSMHYGFRRVEHVDRGLKEEETFGSCSGAGMACRENPHGNGWMDR